MLEVVEKEIIKTLNEADIFTKKYFGELKNPKAFKENLNHLPLVFIDFVNSKPINLLQSEATYSLYEVHVAFSKNETTRSKKHYELYDLQKTIKNKLKNKVITKDIENNISLHSEPIKIGKLEKIYDSIFKNGYLTVFKQEFTIIIKEEL